MATRQDAPHSKNSPRRLSNLPARLFRYLASQDWEYWNSIIITAVFGAMGASLLVMAAIISAYANNLPVAGGMAFAALVIFLTPMIIMDRILDTSRKSQTDAAADDQRQPNTQTGK